MNETGDLRPAITIDMKKGRVRIYKQTLHLLGDPAYVQFLVNPKKKLIAILGSDHAMKGGSSNRVSTQNSDAEACVECYSLTLTSKLLEIIGNLDANYSYRVLGEVNNKERIAQFSLKAMQRIEN